MSTPGRGRNGSSKTLEIAAAKRVRIPCGRFPSSRSALAVNSSVLTSSQLEAPLDVVPRDAGLFFQAAGVFFPEGLGRGLVHEAVQNVVVRLATYFVGPEAAQGLRLDGDRGEGGR